MKLWLCCGLLLALLGGCGDDAKTPDGSGQVQSPEQNISGEGTGDSVEVTPTDEPEVEYEAIPEHWQSVDSQNILWQVPNAEVAKAELYTVLQIGEYPYLCRGTGENREIIKMNFSNETILQQTVVELGWLPFVQALENGIVVYYKYEGNVVVLNADLQEIARYQTKSSRGDWYFGKDGSILYDFQKDSKLVKIDLPTGNRETLLENMEDSNVLGANINYVNFYYTDTVEEKMHYMSLNLQTGQLDEIPFREEVTYLYREGECWLGKSYLVEDRYMIYWENDEAFELASQTGADSMDIGMVYLMDSKNHILTHTVDGTRLMLYDHDGKFISECQIPEGYRVLNLRGRSVNSFIWDEVHGGYYFIAYETPDTSSGRVVDYTSPEIFLEQKLFFWDIHTNMSGVNLELKKYDIENPSGLTVSASLYERAKQLSEKYDLDIKIAEQVARESYGKPAMEEEKISSALDLLELFLSEYGTTYLEEKVYYKKYSTLEIHLLKDVEMSWALQEADATYFYTDKMNYKLEVATNTEYVLKKILYIDLEHMTKEDYREVFKLLEESKENWEYNHGR